MENDNTHPKSSSGWSHMSRRVSLVAELKRQYPVLQCMVSAPPLIAVAGWLTGGTSVGSTVPSVLEPLSSFGGPLHDNNIMGWLASLTLLVRNRAYQTVFPHLLCGIQKSCSPKKVALLRLQWFCYELLIESGRYEV